MYTLKCRTMYTLKNIFSMLVSCRRETLNVEEIMKNILQNQLADICSKDKAGNCCLLKKTLLKKMFILKKNMLISQYIR